MHRLCFRLLQQPLFLFVVFYLSWLLTTEPTLLAWEGVAPTNGFWASQDWLGCWSQVSSSAREPPRAHLALDSGRNPILRK